MHKQLVYLLLFLLIGLNTSFGQIGQDITIGASLRDELQASIHQDGITTLFFNSLSPISGDKSVANHAGMDVWIAQLDGSYNVVNQRILGGVNQEFIRKAIQAPDSGFLMTVFSGSGIGFDKTEPSFGGIDFWIVKLNSDLSIAWQRSYGSLLNDDPGDIVYDNDGNIYVIGSSFTDTSPPGGNRTAPQKGIRDLWLIKLDADGNEIWQNSYGGDTTEFFPKIAVNSYNEVFIASYSNSPPSIDKTATHYGSLDTWLLKLDEDGAILGQTSLGTEGSDFIGALSCVGDAVFVASNVPSEDSGNKTSGFYGGQDIWVVQLDRDLNLNWQQTYGGIDSDLPADFYHSATKGSTFIAASSSSSNSGMKTTLNRGGSDYWLLEIDGDGEVLNQYGAGGISNEGLPTVTEVDGQLLVAGISNSDASGDKTENGKGDYDAWLVEFDVALSVGDIQKQQDLAIYPNPTSGTILVDGLEGNNLNVDLFDATGRLILSEYTMDSSIDLSKIQNGVYFLKIEGFHTQRIVKH